MKLNDIILKLPRNKEVAEEILKLLQNENTKCVLDKDIKNSYYVYLNDTMYISDNDKTKNDGTRICLVAHECWHSIQSKLLQKLNFIFSNIELVLFVIVAIISFFTTSSLPVYIYAIINIISLIFRFILEQGAIKNSLIVSKQYLKLHLNDEETTFVMNEYLKKMKFLYLPFIFFLIFGRLIRFVIIYILYFII